MVEDADIIVLGGGIVGVCVAVHLQMRGKQVILADRRAPGEETSFGNAGLIQREAVFPHHFPRGLADLFRYAKNKSTDAYYHPAFLPRLAAPLLRYWYHSEPSRYRAMTRRYAPLILASLDDHIDLASRAGAMHLLRPGGWTQAHETDRTLNAALADAEIMRREFGIEHEPMDARQLAQHEPHLRTGLAGGVHWPKPLAVIDPHALTLAYAAHFGSLGGRIRVADGRGLRRENAAWRVGGLAAPELVVAMGARSTEVTKKLGYNPPIFVKRGYHAHFAPAGNAGLNNAVLDVANGYMLAPMRRGIRLTTGAEFAHRDAPPTPVQLARAEPAARRLLPSLGERLDPIPWMGARPCTPDMMPIIGPAPGQRGAWYAFGHAHHGLTLGPTTGRLLAQMMTGEAPFTDPHPYRAERF